MNSRSFVAQRISRGVLALLALGVFLALPASSPAQNVLVFPQVVAGGSYISFISVGNTNFSATANGTLTIYNQDGSLRPVAIDGRGTNSSFPVTVPPGGTVLLSTSPGGALTVGMAKFVSDFPASGVVRFVSNGNQVGVLDSPRHSMATVLISTNNGNDTGLAISNSGTSPINVRLVYANEAGTTVQSVDPPELNPLPPNGQASKFVEQYGLTQAANQSGGSVQIITKGAGGFNALALLLNGGQFSTTALVAGVVGKQTLEMFQGSSFTGTWMNTTFMTTGGAAASFSGVASTNTFFFKLTLTGPVFGGANPAPTLLSGTINGNTVTANGTSDLFGPVSLTITEDGTLTFTANSVPGPTVATYVINGTAHSDKITGNFTATLKAGGSAVGTIVLNHTNQ